MWQTLPAQLFEENKKFIYSSIKHGARAKDFEITIQWLVDAGLVYIGNSCTISYKFNEKLCK